MRQSDFWQCCLVIQTVQYCLCCKTEPIDLGSELSVVTMTNSHSCGNWVHRSVRDEQVELQWSVQWTTCITRRRRKLLLCLRLQNFLGFFSNTRYWLTTFTGCIFCLKTAANIFKKRFKLCCASLAAHKCTNGLLLKKMLYTQRCGCTCSFNLQNNKSSCSCKRLKQRHPQWVLQVYRYLGGNCLWSSYRS